MDIGLEAVAYVVARVSAMNNISKASWPATTIPSRANGKVIKFQISMQNEDREIFYAHLCTQHNIDENNGWETLNSFAECRPARAPDHKCSLA